MMTSSGYYVWNPKMNAPRHRHDSRAAAVHEAERMAAKQPGDEFIVLAALGSAQMQSPCAFKRSTTANDLDLPF